MLVCWLTGFCRIADYYYYINLLTEDRESVASRSIGKELGPSFFLQHRDEPSRRPIDIDNTQHDMVRTIQDNILLDNVRHLTLEARRHQTNSTNTPKTTSQ
jgi:hypothetical protein